VEPLKDKASQERDKRQYLINLALESLFKALDDAKEITPDNRESYQIVAGTAMGLFLKDIGLLSAKEWAERLVEWEHADRV
jgi:hypothetical protein